MNEKFSQYAHPEALVDTQWVEDHLKDPNVRVIESNEDVLLYDTGHIPGAIQIDWRTDLQDETVRDFITAEEFAMVCENNGISQDTTCVFYGDQANWWACYALWVFRLFGHNNVRIMDGGREKWVTEGRELTKGKPSFDKTEYPIPPKRMDDLIRAFYEDTLQQSQSNGPLIDVRSPGEFRGEITHMPEHPREGVLRGGHVPGAENVPWKMAAREDSTFKPVDELRKIYTDGCGLTPDENIICYCRIGERSSHTWFVLTYLLGYKHVRNYDGSWTEWGNTVRAPIEKGD